jgi:hypothetical protein
MKPRDVTDAALTGGSRMSPHPLRSLVLSLLLLLATMAVACGDAATAGPPAGQARVRIQGGKF